MAQTPKNIAIVGSGLVGSLLAIYLRKRKHSVTVFDRRPDIRTIKFSGRSINLAMSNRGWRSLEKVGLVEKIKEIAIPLDKRAMHVENRPVYFQKYGNKGEAIWSISRGILNKRMIDMAEAEGVIFRFNEKVWDIDLSTARLYTGESKKEIWKEYRYDLVFGCDGAFSRIRHKMQRQSRFDYSQEFIKVGYKELTIPANVDGTHKLDKNSFHFWPRRKFMMIAMPNMDASFTCTLFLPFEGKVSFESIATEDEARAFFKEYFPNVWKDIEDLTKDFFNNPTSAMVTMKCYPWAYLDKVALVGDSAHTILPFYGQGMNAGFESIYILDKLMDSHEDDWSTIFSTYQKERKPNTDAITELSYRNFMEMGSKAADLKFLLQKKIEKYFASKYPDKWVLVYSAVTFSEGPYKEALAIGNQQEKIMKEVMKLPDIDSNWDSKEVENKILELLNTKETNNNGPETLI